jgi:hypothetical protein
VGNFVGLSVGIELGALEGLAVGVRVGRAVLHLRPVHTLLSQSRPKKQLLPWLQPWHSLPPQSTSVSNPFLMPSLHVNGVGVRVGAEVGDCVGNCVGCSVGDSDGAGDGTKVGAGVLHAPFVQMLLRQSLPNWQLWPAVHPWHSSPPQSISVSWKFCMPSLHVAGVGLIVGAGVGEVVGLADGASVGEVEGLGVGVRVGRGVLH